MYKIEVKKGIALIKKHDSKAKLAADIHIDSDDGDKSLITGEVLSENGLYKKGDTIIFGKYSTFELVLQGEKYNFIDEEDIIAVCDYKQK